MTFHGDVVAAAKAAAQNKRGLARQLLDAFELITELRRDVKQLREDSKDLADTMYVAVAKIRERLDALEDQPPLHEDAGRAEDADYIRYIAKTFFTHRHFTRTTMNAIADRMEP